MMSEKCVKYTSLWSVFENKTFLLSKAAFIYYEIVLQFRKTVFFVNICSTLMYLCDQSRIFSII